MGTDRLHRPAPAPPQVQPEPRAQRPPAARSRRRLQFRRTVGAVDDPLEREADAVARRIARLVGSRPTAQTVFEPVPNVASKIRRRADGPSGGEIDAASEAMLRSAAGGGAGLQPGVRAQMETAFGTDLSAVRLHTDRRAGELNQAFGAQAFTTGADIFFRDGQPNLHSVAGRELLAHELTHVVQQRPDAVARRADAVIRRVVWADTDVVTRAGLSKELREGLDAAKASPNALPGGPGWLRARLILEDNLDLAAKQSGPGQAAAAQKKWDDLKDAAKARLDEATFKADFVSKANATALKGQTARVDAYVKQRLEGIAPDGKAIPDGKFKWKETFNNLDGDLPGIKGGGGYHEYYAEPDAADPPNAGFWGRNRVLHNVTVGGTHSDGWWVTADHYVHYVRVTDA